VHPVGSSSCKMDEISLTYENFRCGYTVSIVNGSGCPVIGYLVGVKCTQGF